MSTPGCGSRTGLEVPPPAVIPAMDNAHACQCTCSGPAGAMAITQTIQVCVPPALNRNLDDTLPPVLSSDLAADCSGRVATGLFHAAELVTGVCSVPFINPAITCTCTSGGPSTNQGPACDAMCVPMPLLASGANFKTATTVAAPGAYGRLTAATTPICLVPGTNPPEPQPEGFIGRVFGPASTGPVTSGTTVITIADRAPVTNPVRGEVAFFNPRCPGESCALNMSFQLETDPVPLGDVLGFIATARLEDINVGGAGVPGALVVDELGLGSYGVGEAQAWGRGTVVERILGIEVGRERSSPVFASSTTTRAAGELHNGARARSADQPAAAKIDRISRHWPRRTAVSSRTENADTYTGALTRPWTAPSPGSSAGGYVRDGIGLLVASLMSLVTACGARTGLEVPEPETIPAADNAYLCDCTCRRGPPFPTPPMTTTLAVCLPEELNPNRGHSFSLEDLEHDCAERVVNIAHASAATMMGTGGIACDTFCECTARPETLNGGPSCDLDCPTVPLTGDPLNIKEATVRPTPWPCFVPGDDDRPVCRVPGSDPPEPVAEGAFASFLTPRSEGDVVTGTALVILDGDAHVTAVSGSVSFPGTPCPGLECDANLAFRLRASPVEVGSFLGLADVTLEGLQTAGAGTPGALVLDSTGRGTYPTGTVQAWGRGDAVERVAGFETGRTRAAFLMTNTAPVDVRLDWAGRTFGVEDEFSLPGGDDPATAPAVSVAVTLEGDLTNQPPSAVIDVPPSIECSSPDGAAVTLDGSPSTDRDDNIADYVWRDGTALSDPVLAFGPTIVVLQATGTSEMYSLLLLDQGFTRGDATAMVSVVDTVAPTFDEVAATPTCLWSPNHKFVRFELGAELQARASDVCDVAPIVRIAGVSSDEPADGRGDGATSPDILFGESGFCIRSERSGTGDGRTYTVTLAAEDSAGNASTREVEIRVPHDAEPGCEQLRERLLTAPEAEAQCVFSPVIRPAGTSPPPPRVLEPGAPREEEATTTVADEAGACSAGSARPVSGALLVLAPIAILILRRRRST